MTFFGAALLAIAIPTEAADWAFMESQERFVVECVGLPSAVASLPPVSRSLLSSMAETDWRHREWASRAMLASGDVRACFLGQLGGDPEVRLRCRNVLRRLSACVQCDGKGGKEESWGYSTCGHCRGVGHCWPVEDYEER